MADAGVEPRQAGMLNDEGAHSMTKARRTALLAVAAAGMAALLAACGSPTSSSTGDSVAPAATAASTSSAAGTEADITFAQLMIPHHEQAVQMADIALQQGAGPEVTELATQIKAAQDPEIQQMRSWLTAWGAPEQMPGMQGMDHGNMDMGGQAAEGMMTNDDMAALMDVSGAEFDRMWLTMMIAHHQGAIAMAEQVKTDSTNPDVLALADAIIAGQTTEIDTMAQLLNK